MRDVSAKSVGGAAVASGLLRAFAVWSLTSVVVPEFRYLYPLSSAVSFALALFVSYGLWRLASGRPGEGSLKASFLVNVLSLALVLGLVAVLAVTSGVAGHQDVRVMLTVMTQWGPEALGFLAALLLVVGLLRSALVGEWLAWLIGVGALLQAVSALLSIPSDWTRFAHPTLAALTAPVPAAFVWIGWMSWAYFVAAPIALGIALIGGGGVSNKRFERTP